MTAAVGDVVAESARTISGRAAPARRAAANASASRLAAPRTELVAALRRRGGGDHRRRQRYGDRSEQRIEALGAGIAVPGACLA
ncbi:MAG: hypothetical protein ACJ72I_03865 [Pseudonocardiaceae bacterium]